MNMNLKCDEFGTRRGFLRAGLAAGGMVAASRLPAVDAAEGPQWPFCGRSERCRLSLAYGRVAAGAERPFSILHISDTHLTAAYPHDDEKSQRLKAIRTKEFGGMQEEALRDSIAWAKGHVDYIVHTGDVIDWHSEANFDLVRKYYGEGGAEMFGCVGNHEFSRGMWLEKPRNDDAYRAETNAPVAAAFPFDISFAANVVNGVNFIAIDNAHDGTVTSAQVERFEREAAKGLPIVVCVHVPFYTPGIWLATGKFWKGGGNLRFTSAETPSIVGEYARQTEDPVTRGFVERLKAEPLLKGILAGHVHFTMQEPFSQTAVQFVVGANFLFHGEEILFT